MISTDGAYGRDNRVVFAGWSAPTGASGRRHSDGSSWVCCVLTNRERWQVYEEFADHQTALIRQLPSPVPETVEERLRRIEKQSGL